MDEAVPESELAWLCSFLAYGHIAIMKKAFSWLTMSGEGIICAVRRNIRKRAQIRCDFGKGHFMLLLRLAPLAPLAPLHLPTLTVINE